MQPWITRCCPPACLALFVHNSTNPRTCTHTARRYVVEPPSSAQGLCTEALSALQDRFDAQSARLEAIRKESLPGR